MVKMKNEVISEFDNVLRNHLRRLRCDELVSNLSQTVQSNLASDS